MKRLLIIIWLTEQANPDENQGVVGDYSIIAFFRRSCERQAMTYVLHAGSPREGTLLVGQRMKQR
jgi:hypothetical protein